MKITKKEAHVAYYNLYTTLIVDKKLGLMLKELRKKNPQEFGNIQEVWITEDIVATVFTSKNNPGSLCMGLFYPFSKEENKTSDNYYSVALELDKTDEEIYEFVGNNLYSILEETLKANDIKIKNF